LAVFHFGVYYPLFDLLLEKTNHPKMVVFHNITPKEFLPQKTWAFIDKSFNQMRNIAYADYVLCVSDTNMQVLQDAGLDVQGSVLPLPGPASSFPKVKPSVVDDIIKIAFIGRFVKSKGPNDLLKAMKFALYNFHKNQIVLDMIGNISFSDNYILNTLKNQIEALQIEFFDRVHITIHGDICEENKTQILSNADIFVLPTYHEGFCVPILEALSYGCRVVTYFNSNTPSISGGLATLVPTGDEEELARSLVDNFKIVSSNYWKTSGYKKYTKQVLNHLRHYSVKKIQGIFLRLCEQLASGNLA
jgi:glycosyltransferase involved in cell wall biosynthesis